MTEDDKRTFDACYDLTNFWSSRHDQRRGYEWKMTLGLWTIITFAIGSHDRLRVASWWFWGACSILICAVFVRGWLFPIWKANNIDKVKSFHFAQQAAAVLLDRQQQPQLFDQSKLNNSFRAFSRDWSMRYQFLTTLLLLIGFVVVLYVTRH
jgi:hypothetical protein